MNASSFLHQFLLQLPSVAPHLLLYSVCFVVSLVLRGRAPRAGLLAAIGCAILFGMSFFGALTNSYFFFIGAKKDMSYARMGLFFTLFSILRSVGFFTGFSLVFASVFVGRKRQENHTSPHTSPPL